MALTRRFRLRRIFRRRSKRRLRYVAIFLSVRRIITSICSQLVLPEILPVRCWRWQRIMVARSRDRLWSCQRRSALLRTLWITGFCSRRLYGGVWDGLTGPDIEFYQHAYLANAQDKESPYYCLCNNDLSHNMPASFIATAEFDPLIDDSIALLRTLSEHQQP